MMFLSINFKLTSREKWEIIQKKKVCDRKLDVSKKTQPKHKNSNIATQLLANNHLKEQIFFFSKSALLSLAPKKKKKQNPHKTKIQSLFKCRLTLPPYKTQQSLVGYSITFRCTHQGCSNCIHRMLSCIR